MSTPFAKRSFSQNAPPAWTCPTCLQGRLTVVDEFVVRPNAETSANGGEDWWDADYAEYVFNGMLKCGACGDHVIVGGTGYVSQEPTDDGQDYEYITMLTPRFFVPPLRVITPQVNDEVPQQILDLLDKAHEVCWADPDSALNRLRTIVEEILDFKGVERTRGRTRHGLQKRIELFTEPGMEQVQRALLALKFVGNDGSHGFSGIKHRELLEVFSIVKYCLENLFPIPTDDSFVLTVVERINANKGLRPRRQAVDEEPI